MNGWSTPYQPNGESSGGGVGTDFFGSAPPQAQPGFGGGQPGFGQQPPPPAYGQQPTEGQPPFGQTAYGQPPAYSPPGFNQPGPGQPGFGQQPPSSGTSSTKIGLIIGGVVLAVVVGIGIIAAVFVGSFTSAVPGGAGALFDDLEPGFTYGDNATLDALWDECAGGAFASCDALFFRSEIDSEYEAYGDSCGYRNDPAGLCVDIYDGN